LENEVEVPIHGSFTTNTTRTQSKCQETANKFCSAKTNAKRGKTPVFGALWLAKRVAFSRRFHLRERF